MTHTMTDFIVRPLFGRDVRMYFYRGKHRFILSDALEAFGVGHRTPVALKELRKDGSIRPLSKSDPTETVSLGGMSHLDRNSRRGGGLSFWDFQRSLPRFSGDERATTAPATTTLP